MITIIGFIGLQEGGDEIPVIKNFEGISSYHQGKTHYYLVFQPWRNSKETGVITYKDGRKEQFTTATYRDLMKRFGKKIKVEKMKGYKLIVPRDL